MSDIAFSIALAAFISIGLVYCGFGMAKAIYEAENKRLRRFVELLIDENRKLKRMLDVYDGLPGRRFQIHSRD